MTLLLSRYILSLCIFLLVAVCYAQDDVEAENDGECVVLSSTECAEICVPKDQGGNTNDFACGDWWTQSNCCNGTKEVQFTTTGTYVKCRCLSKCPRLRTYERWARVLALFRSGSVHALTVYPICPSVLALCTLDKGLTTQGLFVIIGASIAALLAVVVAIVYVLFRCVLSRSLTAPCKPPSGVLVSMY